MRHHFHILQSLAAQSKWESLTAYLDEAQGNIPDMNLGLCSVLSNLLKNAMEASLQTAPERRQVKTSARLHSEHMVLLSVENTYDGKIREQDGIFLFSKRPGEGIGLQAVRHTAEKNGGYCRFHYGDGVFCVNVILRGEK